MINISTIRLLFEHFPLSFVRILQLKQYFQFKIILSLVAFILLILIAKNASHNQYSLSTSSKTHPLSLSSNDIQNFLIAKLNLTDATQTSSQLVLPSNYLDPFIYSRIEFTHNDERRSEMSRKWCQTQTKSIRPQDLELSKCIDVKTFNEDDHSICLDSFMRNSCLVMSFGIGNNQIDSKFLHQLYEWGGCRILTFDPYQHPFNTNNTSNSVATIKSNWTYYRLGLTASAAVDDHSNLMTIRNLMEYINLQSMSLRIDILKIDIDNANEWNLLDDNDFFFYICRHVKQLIVKTKPIYSKRFQHYRIFTIKLNRCFSLLRRRSRLYFLGRHNQLETEWALTTFSLNLGLFCDEIDMSMYLLVYGHLYLLNTKI